MGQVRFGAKDDGAVLIELTEKEFSVLPDLCRFFPSVSRKKQLQFIGDCSMPEFLLGVEWIATALPWFHPDLIKFSLLIGRWIELAMTHSTSRAHVLEITRPNDGTVSHAVLVLKLTAHYVGENLRIFMWMHGEAPAWLNDVIVHHDERMKAIVSLVVIIGEGKGKPSMKPSELGFATVFTRSFQNAHDPSLARRPESSKPGLHSFNRSSLKTPSCLRIGMGFSETQSTVKRARCSCSSSRPLRSLSSNSTNPSSDKRSLLKINLEGFLTCRCPLFPNSSR